jgi:hypothetical protein
LASRALHLRRASHPRGFVPEVEAVAAAPAAERLLLPADAARKCERF